MNKRCPRPNCNGTLLMQEGTLVCLSCARVIWEPEPVPIEISETMKKKFIASPSV